MPLGHIAAGNIVPFSFVKLDATQDGFVLQCGAGEQPVGVAQKGTYWAPWDQLQPAGGPFAAQVGEPLAVATYKSKDAVYLGLGLGGAAPGDRLMSDAAGYGVAVAADGDIYGAIALVAGLAGEIIMVDPWLGEKAQL